jgi:hypothetical protein
VDGGKNGPWKGGGEFWRQAIQSIAIATRRTVVAVVVARTATKLSRPLCCVIAKQFLNKTILWYMSKEVKDKSTRKVKQSFSFWAKLLVTRNASPDMCQYPSQTSILSRNGKPAWHHLTSMVDVVLSMVELLDG